jgi:hypothetical protein
MIRLLCCLLFGVATAFAQGSDLYSRYFTEATMRVDVYHTGTKGEERFSLDAVVDDGPWPGSRVNLLDTLGLGEFLFRVYDRASGALIFSRGYSTIFNEWQTTDEAAQGMWRTFSESMRFPMPRRAVQIAIARRDRRLVPKELWTVVIDPADPAQVNRERRGPVRPVVDILVNGDPARKVDILVLGDGYAKADMEKFRRDARHFTDVLFGTKPFSARKGEFNVRAIEVESAESGIDVPDKGVWKSTPLGTMYNTFGLPRYVLSEHNKAIRDIAAGAPYDFLCIILNDSRYGGGGIYNLYAITYAGEQTKGQEWQMDYTYVHEFGHSFAGLGDEYYSSAIAYSDFYPAGVEPWEPNITAQTDPAKVKWRGMLSAGVAVPTPWAKSAYDSVEVLRQKLDRLAPDYYEKREPYYRASMDFLKTSPNAGKVGVFEGAGYASKGLYRPSVDCRMFSLSLADFDPVCSAAIGRMIDFYAR